MTNAVQINCRQVTMSTGMQEDGGPPRSRVCALPPSPHRHRNVNKVDFKQNHVSGGGASTVTREGKGKGDSAVFIAEVNITIRFYGVPLAFMEQCREGSHKSSPFQHETTVSPTLSSPASLCLTPSFYPFSLLLTLKKRTIRKDTRLWKFP